MNKVISVIILGLFSITSALGQQDILSSKYMFNGLALNPAYAGSHNYMNSSLMMRKQWAGFNGAPFSSYLSVDAPVEQKNIGWGASLHHDRIGVVNKTDLIGSFSYKIPIKSPKSTLALGMSGKLSYNSAQVNELRVWDKQDPIYDEQGINNLFPNVGFGVYYYAKNYFAGLSVPHLISYDPEQAFSIKTEDVPRIVRHYYLAGGYFYEINKNVAVKPSFLLRYLPEAPLQADINTNVLLKKTVWLGASYRTDKSLVLLTRWVINKSFSVGYAIDLSFSDIRYHSDGSHEIFIGYRFGKKNIAVPRF